MTKSRRSIVSRARPRLDNSNHIAFVMICVIRRGTSRSPPAGDKATWVASTVHRRYPVLPGTGAHAVRREAAFEFVPLPKRGAARPVCEGDAPGPASRFDRHGVTRLSARR